MRSAVPPATRSSAPIAASLSVAPLAFRATVDESEQDPFPTGLEDDASPWDEQELWRGAAPSGRAVAEAAADVGRAIGALARAFSGLASYPASLHVRDSVVLRCARFAEATASLDRALEQLRAESNALASREAAEICALFRVMDAGTRLLRDDLAREVARRLALPLVTSPDGHHVRLETAGVLAFATSACMTRDLSGNVRLVLVGEGVSLELRPEVASTNTLRALARPLRVTHAARAIGDYLRDLVASWNDAQTRGFSQRGEPGDPLFGMRATKDLGCAVVSLIVSPHDVAAAADTHDLQHDNRAALELESVVPVRTRGANAELTARIAALDE